MKSGLKILKSRWDFSNKKGIMSHFDMRKKRNKFLYLAMIFALFVAVFVCIFPLLWMFFTAFKESIYEPGFFPKALEFKKLADAWKLLKFNKYFLNTVTIVALSLFASLICNGLGAFSLAIIKPKGHKIIFFLILITLMVPAVTNMVPLYKNLKTLTLLNERGRFALGLSFGANAFYLVMIKTFFETMPKTVLEAAQIDSCNKIQLFYKVVVPMSISIFMVVAIFTFNASWSDFTLPFLVLLKADTQTVMVRLYVINNDPNIAKSMVLMATLLATIPPVIAFLIFQKQITDNVMASGMKD